MRTALLALTLLCLATAEPPTSFAVSADDVNTNAFAVEGNVFVGEGKKAVMRTTTVFHGNRAYDRLPQSVAVFDFENRKVQLADQQRSLATDVDFKVLLEFQAAVNKRAAQHGGLVAFLANPTFTRETKIDANTSTITLSSPWLTYSARVTQSSSDVVDQFTEFADWSARLANMLNGSPYPAQARLELNEALRRQDWRIVHVTRSGGPRALGLGTSRCERTYRMELSDEDKDLIRQAEKSLKQFKRVSFSDYLVEQNSQRLTAKK